MAQSFLNTSVKIVEFVPIVGVIETQQGNRVLNCFKVAAGFTSHTLGRRARYLQVILGFQLVQFSQVFIKFLIRNKRLGILIIGFVSFFEEATQFFDALFSLFFIHIRAVSILIIKL